MKRLAFLAILPALVFGARRRVLVETRCTICRETYYIPKERAGQDHFCPFCRCEDCMGWEGEIAVG